jgi:hypothetical protein
MLDRFEQIANDAQLAVCIMGNPVTSDFELVPLGTPLTEERRNAWAARGIGFCGIAGVLADGSPRTAFDVPLDIVSVDALARAFLAHIGQLVQAEAARKKESAVQWLAELYAANDPRPS